MCTLVSGWPVRKQRRTLDIQRAVDVWVLCRHLRSDAVAHVDKEILNSEPGRLDVLQQMLGEEAMRLAWQVGCYLALRT